MFMVWNTTCREINWNIWRGCGAVRGEGVKCSETQIQQGTCIYGSWQIAAVMGLWAEDKGLHSGQNSIRLGQRSHHVT